MHTRRSATSGADRLAAPHGASSKVATLATAIAAAAVFAACSSGDDGGSGSGGSLVERGRSVAAAAGCNGCHGSSGEGGVGPAWTGLFGSSVTLSDGSEVTADAAYLRRAITDPGAQRVDGFLVSMPENSLQREDVDAVVAYIESLSES